MRKFLRLIWSIITAPFRFIARLVGGLINRLKQSSQKIRRFFTEEEEDAPVTEAFAKAVQKPQDLLYHLDILRRHLLRGVVAIAITTAFSFFFISKILAFLAHPLKGGITALQAIEVTENIGTVMRVALLSGFALAFPYVIIELWLFIAPGVSPGARIRGMIVIPLATLMFILGMAFAFYVMLPVALPFLFNFMGLTTVPRPSSYYNFVSSVLFWIGISFELPLVAYILAEFGIIKARTLAEQWRLAIIIIAVLAAAITPTVDPVNMAIVMGPLIVLYFLSILLAFFAQHGRENRSKQSESET